jgi:hypothetical protein
MDAKRSARHRQATSLAALTFSAVNGTERRRAPTASKTAFEIAAATIATEGSPTAHGFFLTREHRRRWHRAPSGGRAARISP